MFRRFSLAIILTLGFVLSGCAARETAEEYDVVIYGGTFAGCAAARTAAQLAPESSILVIVPVPERMLGGIGTAGGQNFFDVRLWRGHPVTAGSFARWYGETGQFYNPQKMADLLAADLSRYKNITVLWSYDIQKTGKGTALLPAASKRTVPLPVPVSLSLPAVTDVGTVSLPALPALPAFPAFRITNLRLREVCRDGDGVLTWGKGVRKVTGRVFIDASDDGRLTRLAGASVTVGRGDWPDRYLPPGEQPDKTGKAGKGTVLLPALLDKGSIPVTSEKKPVSMPFSSSKEMISSSFRQQNQETVSLPARRPPAAHPPAAAFSPPAAPLPMHQPAAPMQQAATLMFKVSGVVLPPTPRQAGDLLFLRDPSGSWGIVGGTQTYRRNPVIIGFNDRHAPRGFALKPINAAQDGAGSDQWWVNALLIFNVDGRACRRDKGAESYPPDQRPDAKDVDEALLQARELLARPEFLAALRQFSATDGGAGEAAGADKAGADKAGADKAEKTTGGADKAKANRQDGYDGQGGQGVQEARRYGFHRAELVKDENGRPVTGSVLYLRETVHLQREKQASVIHDVISALSKSAVAVAGKGKGTVPGKGKGTVLLPALTAEECQLAGAGPADGADRDNHATRIGLGYYLMDINAYTPADLKPGGAYRWPVTEILRPDLRTKGGQPQNPVYLPYEMLVTLRLVNLLAPGYATGAASLAWAEVRVIPNLCVLGDAAGAAAAQAVLTGADPALFGLEEIKQVQAALRKTGARLDK